MKFMLTNPQGGPGCSSFDGLMMEVGPWRVDGKGGLKRVEGGWEEYTTMVYSELAPSSVLLHILTDSVSAQSTNLLALGSLTPRLMDTYTNFRKCVVLSYEITVTSV